MNQAGSHDVACYGGTKRVHAIQARAGDERACAFWPPIPVVVIAGHPKVVLWLSDGFLSNY
ncbi:MAG: hypothetical protein AMXMBFR61_10770 [Fimbriimonadales bacterium]